MATRGPSPCIIRRCLLPTGRIHSSLPCPQLPADNKKKKGGKGKGKGKGKKTAEPGGAVGASGARLQVQEALSSFGWEVSELLRAMSTALKVGMDLLLLLLLLSSNEKVDVLSATKRRRQATPTDLLTGNVFTR